MTKRLGVWLLLVGSAVAAEESALLQQLKAGMAQAKLVRATLDDPQQRDAYFRALGALDHGEATEALRGLSKNPSAAARELLALSARQPERSTRLAAIDVLPEALGADAVPLLLKLARSGDFRVSESAIISVGYMKDARAWSPLLRMLEWESASEQDGSTSPRKSGALLKALATLFGDLKDPRLLNDLLIPIPDALEVERFGALRLTVIADSKSEAGVPVLLAVLNDPDDKDTRNSILGLGWDLETQTVLEAHFGEQSTMRPLRPLPVGWKVIAAQGLAKARSPRGLQYLVKALQHTDAGLRLAALRGLSSCMPKPRPQDLFDETVAVVIPLLTDGSRKVRDYAWRWLKRETKQDLPLSYPQWRRWNERRLQRTAEQAEEEEGLK